MPLPETDESKHRKSSVANVEKKMLLRKISQMNNLPTPSGNMMKVMLLLRDEDVKIVDLVEAIEKDQSMVAQILKLVNSGFYGLRKTVETVEHAIALLGIINTKQVVYSASIMEFFSDDEQLEWNHSYTSSVLMGNFIKENELPGINILPLAMLMHDLGKVVLRRFAPKKYQVLLQHAAAEKLPSFRFEDDMLQINHAEVGAMLLEKWDTAEEIVKPVLQHHMIEVPEAFVFETALVQFVNWIDCTARGVPCLEPTRELMNAAGIEEIDKNYWLEAQVKLIDSLENNVVSGRKTSTSGTLMRENCGTDTKSLEKRLPPAKRPEQARQAAPEPVEAAPSPSQPFAEPVQEIVTPSKAADGDNETAELISLPEGEEEGPGAQFAASSESQPRIKTNVKNSTLSDKELSFLKKTYKTSAEAVQSQAEEPAPQPPPEAEEPEPVPGEEYKTKVLRRSFVSPKPQSIHKEPPPELFQEVEEPQAAQAPSAPVQDRPTQVLSRKTGLPVPAPATAPETPVQEASVEEAAPSEEVSASEGRREEPVVLTTHASLAPVFDDSELRRPARKGFFERLVDWLKSRF